MHEDDDKYNEANTNLIKQLKKEGVQDPEQLVDDMQKDPFHADPDMEVHCDPTIDDRLK